MPLITERKNREKTRLNLEISSKIEQEIQKYCEWAGITDVSYFVEEAAHYIFINDEKWIKAKKEL